MFEKRKIEISTLDVLAILAADPLLPPVLGVEPVSIPTKIIKSCHLNPKRKLFIRNISTQLFLCNLAHLVPILAPATALLGVPLLGPVLPLYGALLLPPPGPEPLGGTHSGEVLLNHKESGRRIPCFGIDQEEPTAP